MFPSIIKELNVDDKDLRLINNLYNMQASAIRVENHTSKYIQIKKGVRQECEMSPDLFNIYIASKFSRRSKMFEALKLTAKYTTI